MGLRVFISLRFSLAFVLVFLLVQFSSGQDKYEREYRIRAGEVPDKAMDFIASIGITKKVKWYYEEGLNSVSVEAKFVFNDSKYSVEFDTLGQLQDIEVLTDLEDIPDSVSKAISQELDGTFSRHKIRKVQVQYVGDLSVLRSLVLGEAVAGTYTTRYEIVVRGKKESRPALYEVTFNPEGKIEKISKIIFKNADNLEY